MNYEQFYDKEGMCLKTEKVLDSSQLEPVGYKTRGDEIRQSSFWYKGFIDQSCFPDAAHVSYNPEGWTGPETRVDYDGVVPKKTD
jgi:hypothetical protein